jgi:hypothetical protein
LKWDYETCFGVADGPREGESKPPEMTMVLKLGQPEPSGGDGLNRLQRPDLRLLPALAPP